MQPSRRHANPTGETAGPTSTRFAQVTDTIRGQIGEQASNWNRDPATDEQSNAQKGLPDDVWEVADPDNVGDDCAEAIKKTEHYGTNDRLKDAGYRMHLHDLRTPHEMWLPMPSIGIGVGNVRRAKTNFTQFFASL